MGHYDDPVKTTTDCERCDCEIEYNYSYTAPTYCNDCQETLRDPDNIRPVVSVDVDPDRSTVFAEVALVNDNPVSYSVSVKKEYVDEQEQGYPVGIIGYLRLESGDSYAEIPILQNHHVMDAGSVRIGDEGRSSYEAHWTSSSIVQKKMPTVKYEGTIGHDIQNRLSARAGDPFDGDEVTAMFYPASSIVTDHASTTENVPEFTVDL